MMWVFSETALTFISVVSAVATVVALVLSLIQFRQAHSQTRELRGIGRSLSTRYIGEFPDYLGELIDLIGHAEKELVVFCDFPAYARFSAPERWLEYRQAIERKAKQGGFKLNFTCLDQEHRRVQSRDQFNVSDELVRKWLSDARSRDRLQGLVNEHQIVESVDELTADLFLNVLEAADKSMLGNVLTRPAIVHQLPFVPLYFWVSDGKEAIFSFPSVGTEYGFRTSDRQLIIAFGELERQAQRLALSRLPQDASS